MNKKQMEILNDYFLHSALHLLSLEEQCLRKICAKDLSIRELHVLEAVSSLRESGRNTMAEIARYLERRFGVPYDPNSEITVTVGAVEHPMLDVHFIEWILLETATGFQVKKLLPGMKPSAVFTADEKVLAAYEYCNLHGLWVKEI